MRTRFIAPSIIIGLFIASTISLAALTGEEIIQKMESNQVHKTSQSEGSMTITDRFGTRIKTYKAYSEGEDKTLLECTNPEEAGQKILRFEEEIYLYFPEAEEIIHLQGAALKDRVMGSDFSYEDLTGGKDLLDSYEVDLEGSDAIEGVDCYRIRLTAKKGDIVYPIQVVWVDKERFIYRRVMQYSLKGRELKEMNMLEYRVVAGKNVPTHMEMEDKMKKNSKTVFLIEKIEIGMPIDPTLFSLEELSW